MGWRMHEQAEPLKSPELGMLSQYLEIDCKAMWAVLSWMRAVAVEVDSLLVCAREGKAAKEESVGGRMVSRFRGCDERRSLKTCLRQEGIRE